MKVRLNESRDCQTYSLFRSLVVAFVAFLIVFLATSCAPVAPRAIIPSPSVVRELNVKPVTEAGRRTREAVRDVGRGVDDSSNKAERVSDETKRLKELLAKAKAGAKEDMETSLAAADAIADSLLAKVGDLRESLRITAAARDIAIATVDEQQKVIGDMAVAAEGQTIEIRNAKINEVTLRTEVESLAKLPDQLSAQKQKASTLEWWVWRLGILSIILALAIAALGYLLLKP